MRIIGKKKVRFYYIIIYLSLLLFAGYYFVEYATTVAIILIGGMLLYYLISEQTGSPKIERTESNQVLICILMIILSVITQLTSSLIYRGDISLEILLYNVATLLIGWMLSATISIKSFKKVYVNTMVLITIVSIVGYAVFIIAPKLVTIFPVLVNSQGRAGYFLLFTTISDFSGAGIHRNQGIFWEPGAFQVFISLAYIFELSTKEHKARKWVLVLFLIGIVTTFSTTGIIIGLLLLLFTLIRNKRRAAIIRAFIIIGVLVILIAFVLPRITGYLEYAIIGKIQMMFNYQLGDNNVASSRMDSIIYPLREFIKSPLLGIGDLGYAVCAEQAGHTMFTCTPINWIVKYGLIYGGLIYLGLWKFFKKLYTGKLETIIIMLIFLLSISTEALQNNVIILALSFMGYIRSKYTYEEVSSNCV